jgi:hypothetical protein
MPYTNFEEVIIRTGCIEADTVFQISLKKGQSN